MTLARTFVLTFYSSLSTLPLPYIASLPYVSFVHKISVKAADVFGKKVELMIETLQAGAIVCARGATPNPLNMANSRLVNQCATQRLYACFNGPIDPNMDLDLLIYCNSGCRSADTDFWYRITTSTSTWQNPTDANGMDVEMWCDMQMALNTTIFPSQLAPAAPADFKIADTSVASTYEPNAAVSVGALAASALAAVGAAAMAVLLM
jgi:hypothetical protein